MGWHDRFDITAEVMSHLKACAAQRKTIGEACEEIGVPYSTLYNALIREGKREQISVMFCREIKVCGEFIRISAADLKGLPIPDNTQTRWLKRSWRTAA